MLMFLLAAWQRRQRRHDARGSSILTDSEQGLLPL